MEWRIPLILWLTLAGVSKAADGPKAPPVKEPELRAELIRRAKADQDIRGEIARWMMPFGQSEITDPAAFEASLDAPRKAEFPRLIGTIRRVDAESTERLGAIVERRGWSWVSLKLDFLRAASGMPIAERAIIYAGWPHSGSGGSGATGSGGSGMS